MARLKRAYARNVGNLTPLIGDAAARLTVQANDWLAAGWLLGFMAFLPLVIWAQLRGPAVVWIPAAASGSLVVYCLVRGALLGYRSGAVASAHVSAQLGQTVRLSGGGWRPEVWERRIARARQRADQASTRGA